MSNSLSTYDRVAKSWISEYGRDQVIAEEFRRSIDNLVLVIVVLLPLHAIVDPNRFRSIGIVVDVIDVLIRGHIDDRHRTAHLACVAIRPSSSRGGGPRTTPCVARVVIGTLRRSHRRVRTTARRRRIVVVRQDFSTRAIAVRRSIDNLVLVLVVLLPLHALVDPNRFRSIGIVVDVIDVLIRGHIDDRHRTAHLACVAIRPSSSRGGGPRTTPCVARVVIGTLRRSHRRVRTTARRRPIVVVRLDFSTRAIAVAWEMFVVVVVVVDRRIPSIICLIVA